MSSCREADSLTVPGRTVREAGAAVRGAAALTGAAAGMAAGQEVKPNALPVGDLGVRDASGRQDQGSVLENALDAGGA
jgi:hypothetical protein